MNVSEHSTVAILGGRVIDPFTGRDEIADLFVVDGRIARVADSPKGAVPADAYRIDAGGCIVCPGLLDMHVHLREPGPTHKETIETGTAAAAAGGFTGVACMPNTAPPIDSPDTVRWILERAAGVGHCDVLPIAAITRGREGRAVCDFEALRSAGAAAFSDDGTGVEDDAVMLAAFQQAARLDALLIQHCEYAAVSAGGVMHPGDVSRRLGLPGLDPRSEEAMIERDIDLCRRTGGRYHVAHISTARAVEMVRRARREGLPVTAEVCTHHLLLTDEACAGADPNTKMHPPLRPMADVEACRAGLRDGTIDCIVTDHAPHAAEEKAVGFLNAPAGIVGLETALGIAAEAMIGSQPRHLPLTSRSDVEGHEADARSEPRQHGADAGSQPRQPGASPASAPQQHPPPIEPHSVDWAKLIGWMTAGPARVLRRPPNPIEPGRAADLTILDPHATWRVLPESFESKGRNTPFAGRTLVGRARATIRGRQIRRAATTPARRASDD